jgi:hypothetical protein
MRALADSAAFWVLLVVALVVIYLLPTLIGVIRGVDALALVFLVNLIGAPTVIGWVAAMILAFGPQRLPPEPPWPAHPHVEHEPPGFWMPDPHEPRSS